MARVISKNSYFLKRNFNHVSDLSMFSRQLKIAASKLEYSEYGDPVKVVKRISDEICKPLQANEILVKMLAAPVNPSDMNTIQGKYPVRPPLPSVPGNEGVAEIIAVGSNVQKLVIGDRVIPLTNALGTWRTHLVLTASDIYKIPIQLGLAEAATFTVNPVTAYRMLRDFVNLKPGDTVIQNGGNSACGQNVIQIARAWGMRTVNIVRNRPNIDELKEYLKKLGATYVLTEEELRTTKIFKSGAIKNPCLGLNCVGGKSSLELIRHLNAESTLVTYGGMSLQPVTIPTGGLIFKDIRVRGFWCTKWSENHAVSSERREMFDELISMMTNGELHSAVSVMVPFNNFKDALLNTLTVKGMIGKKYILDFQAMQP